MKLFQVFDSYKALPRASVYYCIARCKDGSAVMVINSAPVVLPLANPGFDSTSTLDDHHFQIDGWPLAGLHQSAPVGMSGWWRPRLRSLCQRYGDQFIRQTCGGNFVVVRSVA